MKLNSILDKWLYFLIVLSVIFIVFMITFVDRKIERNHDMSQKAHDGYIYLIDKHIPISGVDMTIIDISCSNYGENCHCIIMSPTAEKEYFRINYCMEHAK